MLIKDNPLYYTCYIITPNVTLKYSDFHIDTMPVENGTEMMPRELSALTNDDAFDVFGVELETVCPRSSYTNQKIARFFEQTPDGSIHPDGRGRGIEWVSRPMDGKTGKVALQEFEKFAVKNRIGVNKTCGYHLHLFFPRYLQNLKTMKKVILAYYFSEKFWLSLVPASRQNNTFAKSLKTVFTAEEVSRCESISDLFNLYYERRYASMGKAKERQTQKYPSGGGVSQKRYAWMNIHSIILRNTLEIRLHSGTVSAKKIYSWYRLHKKFMRWVERHSMKDIENMRDEGTDFLLREIFKTKSFRDYIGERQSAVTGSFTELGVNARGTGGAV